MSRLIFNRSDEALLLDDPRHRHPRGGPRGGCPDLGGRRRAPRRHRGVRPGGGERPWTAHAAPRSVRRDLLRVRRDCRSIPALSRRRSAWPRLLAIVTIDRAVRRRLGLGVVGRDRTEGPDASRRPAPGTGRVLAGDRRAGDRRRPGRRPGAAHRHLRHDHGGAWARSRARLVELPSVERSRGTRGQGAVGAACLSRAQRFLRRSGRSPRLTSVRNTSTFASFSNGSIDAAVRLRIRIDGQDQLLARHARRPDERVQPHRPSQVGRRPLQPGEVLERGHARLDAVAHVHLRGVRVQRRELQTGAPCNRAGRTTCRRRRGRRSQTLGASRLRPELLERECQTRKVHGSFGRHDVDVVGVDGATADGGAEPSDEHEGHTVRAQARQDPQRFERLNDAWVLLPRSRHRRRAPEL